MKKFLKIIAGLAVIAGILFCLGKLREKRNIKEPEPEVIRPVRVMTLENINNGLSKKYFGTVQGGKRVDLSFRVSGPLKNILVEKGANVKRGALLATLDTRDFNTRLRQAQSAQAQAQAQYDDAQTNFKRYENLYKQRAVSKSQYDTAKTQVDVTRSAVNTAAAQTAAARDALKDTELRAPFDGVIADRMVENFQDITAKQTIFSLQDISTLEIVFNIPDNDILLAPLPDGVSLKTLTQDGEKLFTLTAQFDAMPDKIFPLKLKEFAAQADMRTNTYPVTAVMPQQKDANFLPGMAVTVNVEFNKNNFNKNNNDNNNENNENIKYYVPATAILNEGTDENFVWRFLNDTVNKIPVKVGAPRSDGYLEISGVEHDSTRYAGEELKDVGVIVTAGVHFLREGQKVRMLREGE